MGCGMVRKVDELGRVVIPKEMRRVLNIKTGSSIEMFINDNNQVVLKKFSEINNTLYLVENLIEIIFDCFNLKCLVSDDEQIVACKGFSKKEYLNKKIPNILIEKEDYLEQENNENRVIDEYGYTYVFPIKNEGFDCGYVFVFNVSELDKHILNSINVLIKFLSNMLKF